MEPERSASHIVISRTAEYVREAMLGEGSGHDWWHVDRVWRMAQRIGKEEKADLLVVQLGALLHDIADWKFHDNDASIGPRKAREWLEKNALDVTTVNRVAGIVASVSFKGARVPDHAESIEAAVVQDADRLDAIGAIGIARTFAYGGFRGREIYNPNIEPEFHETAEAYRANVSPTINHFYEKLLLLKDRMLTATGRRIAEERHQYMLQYLERFQQEWNGDM
jgi:uncharacterized protein